MPAAIDQSIYSAMLAMRMQKVSLPNIAKHFRIPIGCVGPRLYEARQRIKQKRAREDDKELETPVEPEVINGWTACAIELCNHLVPPGDGKVCRSCREDGIRRSLRTKEIRPIDGYQIRNAGS